MPARLTETRNCGISFCSARIDNRCLRDLEIASGTPDSQLTPGTCLANEKGIPPSMNIEAKIASAPELTLAEPIKLSPNDFLVLRRVLRINGKFLDELSSLAIAGIVTLTEDERGQLERIREYQVQEAKRVHFSRFKSYDLCLADVGIEPALLYGSNHDDLWASPSITFLARTAHHTGASSWSPTNSLEQLQIYPMGGLGQWVLARPTETLTEISLYVPTADARDIPVANGYTTDLVNSYGVKLHKPIVGTIKASEQKISFISS